MSLTNPKHSDRKKISEIKNLPVLPKVMQQLLELKNNDNAGAQQLSDIISNDPVMAAHFLKASNSAFFANAKEITSLTSAIHRIGYTIALNMAIAASANRSFNIPKEGPIGMRSLWTHAVYSATLMQLIAIKIPNQDVSSDTAFLSGLLQNIGFVVLGDQFCEEFNLINNNIKNSKKSLLELEEIYLGISHTELGVLLMRSWGLPKEIIISIFEHHNEKYKGNFWEYSNLAYIANFLLSELILSDINNTQVPDALLDALGLNEELLSTSLNEFTDQKEKLDDMIANLFSA